jgi:hypothetical protein
VQEDKQRAIDQERLRLERQKLALEIRLKRRELGLQKRKTLGELLTNPLILAIVGGFLTLMTSLVTTYLTMKANRDADERRADNALKADVRKLEADLLKTFLQAPDAGKRRENLSFLLDTSLLNNYAEPIRRWLTANPQAAPQAGDASAATRPYPACPLLWDTLLQRPSGSPSPIGLLLHLGSNTLDPRGYGGWDGELKSPVPDANAMASLARKQGYNASLLLDSYARTDCLKTSMLLAARLLKQDDYFFLTFSGHAGQIPDREGEEPDKLDETWVLYDRQILDDDLYRLLSEFQQGVRILVVSDTDHGMTLRQPPNTAGLRAGVLVFSGSTESQVSYEVSDTNSGSGVFTSTLLKVWEDGKFSGTYKQLHEEILRRMSPRQTPVLTDLAPSEKSFISAPAFIIEH